MGSVYASSFYIRPFPERVFQADLIVRAKVGNSYSDWSDGNLFTYAELRIEEVLKGGIEGEVVLARSPGGEKDGIGLSVPGSASFKTGEDVLVFLGEKNGDGSYSVRGMALGRMDIRRDEDGTEYVVDPDPGPGSGRHDHDGYREGQGHSGTGHWSLSDIRALVQKQGKAQREADPVGQPHENTQNTNSTPGVTSQALVLQNENSGGEEPLRSSDSSWIFGALIIITLGILGVLGLRLRRK